MSEIGAGAGLARHILCAVPQLLDPNFRRSVVLLLEHNDQGALGLVINNPLPSSMNDVARSVGMRWLGPADAQARLGGPCEPMRGWILHDRPRWDPMARELMPGVQLTTSLESIKGGGENSIGGNGASVVFLLGYAGWSKGQLEIEIGSGSWLVVPIRADDGPGVSHRFVFETPPESMWDVALTAIGVDPARLSGSGQRMGRPTLH